MTVKRMVMISLFTTLMCVFTVVFPSIPIPFIQIPLTLQTLIIMIAAIILKPRDAFISIVLYVLLGVLGLPVFSKMNSGFGALMGPSGGFIIGFPFVAYLISLFKGNRSFARLFIVNVIFGIILLYLFGIVLYTFVHKYPAESLVIIALLDLIKVSFAAYIGTKLKNIPIFNE